MFLHHMTMIQCKISKYFTEMPLVPADLKPFLVAETPRSEHRLDASSFLIDIGIPSFAGNYS